ncbi:MAG: hypothetical protein QOE70_5289 [Chthoniobacter sp.]|jgi:hypothetical protein|nr:hypothetical protein [Chthoniobacter sp.]
MRAADSVAPPSQTVKAWALLLQVVESARGYVTEGELGGVHNEDMQLNVALSFLNAEARRAGQTDEAKAVALSAFGRLVAELHAAADQSDQAGAQAKLAVMLEAFEALKSRCDEETLAQARFLAARRLCPMHPEITGVKGDPCPKCGMLLDQPVRPSLFFSGGVPSQHTVRASITTVEPLAAGREARATLQLADLRNQPLEMSALREVHTKKIHLLIVDGSLTDYHHEHPTPTGAPGQYAFTFTPRKPGPYRAWADVRTLATGLQEYALADIRAETTPDPLADKRVNLRTQIDELVYELTFANPELKAGQPISAQLRVTTADGKPFIGLEPVMATFAHLVGFAEDHKTVLHLHPKGPPVLAPEARGGPVLEFQFWSPQPGFYRLFAQVQIGGIQKFAPFGVQVAPSGERVAEPLKTSPSP